MFLQILITYLDVITSIQLGLNVYLNPQKQQKKQVCRFFMSNHGQDFKKI